MRRKFAAFLFFGVLVVANTSQAQNLLVNGNFDLTPAQVYYDGFDPTLADDVPGWLISLGAADGSYILVSPESNPAAGVYDADMGIGPAGGSLETAPLLRPAVIVGGSYEATVTTDNYFGPNTTSYFIDWYDGLGALISSNGGLLTDGSGPLTYTPYTQTYSVSAIAPPTASFAGVRFRSGDASYSGLAADNFTFSAVPEPACISLCVCGMLALVNIGWRRRA